MVQLGKIGGSASVEARFGSVANRIENNITTEERSKMESQAFRQNQPQTPSPAETDNLKTIQAKYAKIEKNEESEQRSLIKSQTANYPLEWKKAAIAAEIYSDRF